MAAIIREEPDLFQPGRLVMTSDRFFAIIQCTIEELALHSTVPRSLSLENSGAGRIDKWRQCLNLR
jgi:hypothetical protein